MLKTSLYLIVIFLVGLFIFKFTNNNSANNRITLQNWAKNKILSETAYFQSHHFSKKDVDKTYNDLSAINDNMLIRFQIVDGKVSSNATDTSNPHIIKASNSFHKFFDHLVKQYPLDQNVYFIISISDTLSIPDNYTPTAPIIVPSKYTNSPYAQFLLLAPHYKTVSEWPKIYDDILATNPHYPWEHKVEKAFWRGGFTTSSLTRSNWQDSAINKLLTLSSQNPALIDAEITNISSRDVETQSLLAQKYPLAVNASMLEYTKYKINIKMDDQTAIYPGFLSMLLASCVVLKEQSTREQWFYDILEENKHYISFSNDLSDLLPKIQWIYDNDSEARLIADAGRSIIQKEITPEHLLLYWRSVLESYATMYIQ